MWISNLKCLRTLKDDELSIKGVKQLLVSVDRKQDLCGVKIPWKLLKDEGRKSNASVLPFFES